MANRRHVQILRSGVERWNAWRDENPKVVPDLSGAVLDGKALRYDGPVALNLSGAKLNKARLRHLKLSVDLRDADLFKADLRHVHFYGQLERVEFRRSTMWHVSFEDVTLAGCPMAGARLEHVKFGGAEFLARSTDNHGAGESSDSDKNNTLESAVLEDCDLRDAQLNRMTLRGARIEHCDLRGATGLVLDDNILRGTLVSPKSDDEWSQMRRTYTGARVVFILMASAVFFLPWVAQVGLWTGINTIETRLASDPYRPVVGPAGSLPGDTGRTPPGAMTTPEGVAALLACVDGDGDPAPSSDLGRCLPVWQLMLGWHEDLWTRIVTGLLLFYNVSRLALTWLVAPLRDEEQHSFHTPRYSPAGETGLARLRAYRYCYGWMTWPHNVLKYLIYIVFVLGAFNLLARLASPVWLPNM